MEERRFNSKEELVGYLQGFNNNDYLFRGQASHYQLEDGTPTLSSSISRSGCIPPLMFKWTHYAGQILRLCQAKEASDQNLNFIQALLQHYGWRSFYIDLTSSYNVAAWFGGHKFSMRTVLEMTEDCYETPIVLAHDEAKFTPVENDGHLYILSKSMVEGSGKTLIDLSGIALRPQRQRGWLAGPIPFLFGSKRLDPTCIVGHVVSSASILREIAADEGFTSTATLFPESKDDLFLKYLLSLPWTKVIEEKSLPAVFTRDLRIPEYHFNLTKPYPPEHAFWSPFWIADKRKFFEGEPDPLVEAIFCKVSESIFYAKNSSEGSQLVNLHQLLDKNPTLVVETENLLRYPLSIGTSQYTKGVVVLPAGSSLIEICELVLNHPGSEVTGATINTGYRYRWNGNSLERVVHEGDCHCGNESRHRRLLAVLETLDAFIPKATEKGPLTIEVFP